MQKIKEYKGIIILTFAILIIPSISFAVSGTCSSHGGVNCSAGADYDGSAVCSDGWRDSSERYSSLSLCSFNKPVCTSSERQGLIEKSGINEIYSQIESLEKEQADLDEKIKASPSYMNFLVNPTAEERQMIVQSTYISNQILSLTKSIDMRMVSVNEECSVLGADRYYQEQSDVLETLIENQKQILTPTLPQIPTTTPTCPENMRYLNNKCYCNEGFGSINGDKCKTYDQLCQESNNNDPNIIGSKLDNSVNGTSTCSCKLGYSWNGSQCIINTPPVVTQIPTPEKEKTIPEAVKTPTKTPQSSTESLNNVIKPKPTETEINTLNTSSSNITETQPITETTIPKIPWYKKLWKFIWRF